MLIRYYSGDSKEEAERIAKLHDGSVTYVFGKYWAKGIWQSAFVLNQALTNQVIANLGYLSLTSYYLKVCEN